MKTKIIGVGKCGSRLTYDFFAYISETPTAYDIRVDGNSKFLSFLLNRFKIADMIRRGWLQINMEAGKRLQEMFGQFLIFDPVDLITIDSDNDNNEIMNWIKYINRQGQRMIYPGTSFQLADHQGGCDFHIVSENLCLGWGNMDREIVTNEVQGSKADFMTVAFSIGGGTGGGAAPIISLRCKQYAIRNKKTDTEQMHFMGIGVLPVSDEPYYDGDITPDMSSSEKYNTGRFFVNLYGRRKDHEKDNRHSELYMDSVWLFSNDCLRIARKEADESTTVTMKDPNLSLLNKHIAAALTVICNASSPNTKSEPNFDAMEMNNKLNGYPFMSGFSLTKPDKLGTDAELNTHTVRKLLKSALNNMSVDNNSQLVGLSVPVHEDGLVELNKLLDQEGYKRFLTGLSGFKTDSLPLEFKTAKRVIVIYGQPDNTHSPHKDDLVKKAVSLIFKNSDIEGYYYKHKDEVDILLVLIVNPFIGMVQKSIYYYTDVSWSKGAVTDELMDDTILNSPFSSKSLEASLLADEQILDGFHGTKVVEMINSYKTPSKVGSTYVANTFHQLHDIYHQRKTPVGRSSKIGKVP